MSLKEEKEKGIFMSAMEAMYEELRKWRSEHPGASFDEIAEAVMPKRRVLMGQLLGQLAQQNGDGERDSRSEL